ncbi:hypothetical protein GDO86_016731, partial [Hymenochirus boettgeri]
TLKLMQGSDRLRGQFRSHHQLFALEKLDVTVRDFPLPGGNGQEEVVACAWDGQTYIIDHKRMVLRFQVEENVSAFCAGHYACKGEQNRPCLVYVGFNQKIYIYWAVMLERIESSNLIRVMEGNGEFRSLLDQLHVDVDDIPSVRNLIHQTLYFPDRDSPV